MSCGFPLSAYRTKSGGITFSERNSLTKVPFHLPCGRCTGCRLEYGRQWAMRCMHEAKMSTESTFLTLTYEDEFLPMGGTLVVRDLQLFMKRLRKKKGNGIRFYACGEYGDDNFRPHYHLLLFNCGFADRVYLRDNKRGEKLYCSAECSELWPYGFNVIGDVTNDSAAYVARYVLKKVNGKGREKIDPKTGLTHYEVRDADGVVYSRLPEFAVMSRGGRSGGGGIGSKYYEKFGDSLRAWDSVVVDGREVRPARFYDEKSERYSDALMFYKRRERKAKIDRADSTPERCAVKEEIARRNLELKRRGL